MAASELAAAQREFSEHLQEWAAEYEFIVDSLLEHPGSPCADTVDPYLEQLDRLVAAVDEHPILVRIGGLRESTLRVVKRWQQQLIESVLRTIIRDMIERLEYYFDPAIHALDPGGSAVGSGAVAAARVPTPPQAPTTAAGGGGGVRRSSVSRHQRNLSATSVGSQASQANQNQNQRPGSVLSNTWSAALGDRGTPRNSVSSVTGAFNAAQSPLLINTQPNARGLAHARAVSSAFEALGGHSAAGGGGGDWASDMSLSPSLGLFGIPGAQRLSRASTINHPANRSLAQSTISGARAGVLRRAHRQHSHARTLSSVLADMAEDDSEQQHQQQQLQQAPQPLRRSLSMHRGALRRYRPWLIGTVNRNAPLHVFLADTESWLIQQILERVNPLLERVVQHYLDIEGSQLLKDDDDDDGAAGGACSASQPSLQRRRRRLPLRSATKMRQSFIRTLDECLDAWMSDWVPEAFLYAALARPLHGTRAHVDAAVAGSPMAQYGVAAIADPVVSLLLARFAADFELTLTQSIYQLCEHSIAILPEDGAPPHPQRRDPGSVLSSSADAPMADHLHSLTASAPRTDSFASTSRRGTLAGPRPAAGVLGRRQASHAAKWRAVAEALVRNFVMTVGQDISSDYLKVDLHYNASGSGSGGASEESSDGRSVDSVSGVWLSICRWMKQVEDDTNALFHDPVFSATLKALDASQLTRGGGGGSSTDQNSQPLVQPGAGSRPLAHAHILSNIDRLFAERVDVFPPTVSPLNAGQILFHLAMQIIKTALEALRLRPPVLRTRAEFHQIVVDAAFVRSWMLRYAGVAPALGPAALPDAPDPPSPDGLPIANERNVRAIRNLIDDWVASARACALAPDEPSGRLVDDLVFDAWMIAYFNGGRPPRPRA
ncbi:hypothetical protein H4R19_004775 [Coemansia spiralis]|nr:hypothetical protein H4R19_004775 [Coemansia spiralis]